MGLTGDSSSKRTLNNSDTTKKFFTVALAGNPNVGKSTVFNGLTGMNQHTGNWPGKTVASASGYFEGDKYKYNLIDIPGTYSLMAHSPEEEVARDYICFENPDAVVVVCDATCLERNLNLVLQVIETGAKVLLCVNLLDEAERKKIKIDLEALSLCLGVPVIGTTARNKKSLKALSCAIETLCESNNKRGYIVKYPDFIEDEIKSIEENISSENNALSKRFIALRLLEGDECFTKKIAEISDNALSDAENARLRLKESNIFSENIKDIIVTSLVKAAEDICKDVVMTENIKYNNLDRRFDKIFTSRIFGYPIMLSLLLLVFWITIKGANYPSELISGFLFFIEDKLDFLFLSFGVPSIITNALVHGVYRVLAWVVSVMLPPMAIFFPFFTLLEDSGYLPRIAYNLDKPFKCSGACGKQALTMCMGFGCNAAGVVGCRIIDSPRERLLAILTNSFVPCNGRFPTLIALITMFFVGDSIFFSSVLSALLLTVTVLSGILITFVATKLLSVTVLKGEPSSFALEMPPYRRPQIGKVIIRSIFDRTLFVLGRSIAFAAPAGLVIWLLANIAINDISLLSHLARFLDPFAALMGLDGAILIAFILGLPANEIVIPIIIMTYLSSGTITDISDLGALRALFVSNGWTYKTALSMICFSLFHWPCSTTLMTIKKETGGIKYTLLAFALPTVCGVLICMILNFLL
ncbi:MAG: ferrous iron transport protein B [Ruminococcaceae bacterium]|nr:ferrous iron transport protein B [Oscillospiraceae bacterium]